MWIYHCPHREAGKDQGIWEPREDSEHQCSLQILSGQWGQARACARSGLAPLNVSDNCRKLQGTPNCSWLIVHLIFISFITFHFRKCDVLNRGFSGYNTRWAKIIIPRLIRKGNSLDNPVAVTVFFGANDSALKGKNVFVFSGSFITLLQ